MQVHCIRPATVWRFTANAIRCKRKHADISGVEEWKITFGGEQDQITHKDLQMCTVTS